MMRSLQVAESDPHLIGDTEMFAIPYVEIFHHPTPVMSPAVHAMAYAALDGSIDDVAASYDALEEAITVQYELLMQAGLKIEWIEGEPYPNSRAMHDDVSAGHIRVRATLGDGYEDLPFDHPMMRVVKTLDGDRYRLNDLFRAVHDVYGHYLSMSGFGPDGECVAWLTHRSRMPFEALAALWCETRGQNAWTNFYSDHRDLAVKDRPFAEQRFGTVPVDLI